FNAVAEQLLLAGIPMGPNGLISVPGRKTGLRRTTPVTIIERSGRHWVIGVYGEADWGRNLRAAPCADGLMRGGRHPVGARELSRSEAVAFFGDVFAPLVRRYGGVGAWIVQHVDRIDIADPRAAADGRPVFELVDPSG